MKRIVYVNCRFLTQQITGVQRFAANIALNLKARGDNFVFLSPPGIINKELAEKLDVVIIGSRAGHVWEQLELRRFLRSKNNPLLVNLCNTAPLFYKKNIVTIHDLCFYECPAWFSKKFVWVYKFLIPKIARRAVHVFTVSEFSKNKLIEILGLAPEKITVTYNAADTFSESPYKDNSRGKYLLAVSSLNPRKNFKVIIEAFSEIHDDDLQLFIVGGKHSIFNNSDSNQINENSDRVMWLGYVDDDQLSSLYANALAFVYPSLYEGFGLPPLEAMSLGCPVIVSNLTSLPEVCGDAALYIDPFDPSDVANKIEAILNDPKLSDQLIKKGFERNKLFSWKNSTDIFYQQIVNIMANI